MSSRTDAEKGGGTGGTDAPAAPPRRGRPGSSVMDQFSRRRAGRRVGRRYSRLVAVLRVMLPVAATAVLAGLMLWPTIEEMIRPPPSPVLVDSGPEEEAAVGAMARPSFFGLDAQNQPYTVTGDVARASDPDGVLELDNAQAGITLNDGTWLALRARTARYDEAAGLIELEGDVNVFRDDGYSVHTEHALVDIGTREAWGDAPVLGHGPDAEVAAQGFRVMNSGQTIVFTGQSRLRLRSVGGGSVL